MSAHIAVVGATGLVGRTMLKVLKEHDLPVHKLSLFASKRSAGQTIEFNGQSHTVQELTKDSFKGIDIALFSAGGDASKMFAPYAAQAGCVVVDNSSAWRMHPEVPLVVPEVNPHAIDLHKGIIANPNCSTIQFVVALKPLNDKYVLKRVVLSTYQSISGAGQKGVDQLHGEIAGTATSSPFPHPAAFNAMFHPIAEYDGFSEEEIKVKNETRKIMELPNLPIAVTCVRLPILGGHGESVNIETVHPFTPRELRDTLAAAPGIIVHDDPQNAIYPTPRNADDKDAVFVGRVRMDDSVINGAHLWIVSDNLRKGAATNAVQIASLLLKRTQLNFTPISVKA